jgi:hypothetical protein
MDRITSRISTLTVRAETAEVQKHYSLAIACWKEISRYKGLDDAAEAPERLKKLTESKEVKHEIEKRRELLRVMADLDVHFNQNVNEEDAGQVLEFRKKCLATFRKFAEDNKGTYAADEARSLIEIFERLIGPEAEESDK